MNLGDLWVYVKANTAQFDKELNGAIGVLNKTGAKMTSAGKTMSLALTLPLAGLGATIAKVGMDYEAAMNNVAAISNATALQLQQMEKVTRGLGATTKFSAKEAADGMSFLAMAGFSVEAQMQALPGVLKMAAAGNMDLATSADIASNVLTGFSLQASQSDMVVDVMAKTFTSANTNLTQLGEAMSYAAPTMATFGQSVHTASAAIAAMSDAGIQGSRAGTSLQQIMSSLVLEADKMGVSIYDAAGNVLPLFDILERMEKQGVSAAKIMEVFGARAGPGLLVLMKKGSAGLKEFEESLKESGGTAQRIADTQIKGLKGALTIMQSALSETAIAFSQAGFNQLLEGLANGVTSVAEKMAGWSNGTKTFVLVLGGLAAAAGPVLLAFGVLSSTIIPQVLLGVKMLVGAFSALKVALLTNPITAMAFAVAAVGAAIYAFSQNTEQAVDRQKEYAEITKTATKELVGQRTELDVLKSRLRQSSEQMDNLKKSMQGVAENSSDYLVKSKALKDAESKRSGVITELNNKYKTYLKGNIDTASSYADIAKQITIVNQLLDEQIKKQALQALTQEIMGRMVASQQTTAILEEQYKKEKKILDDNWNWRNTQWREEKQAKVDAIKGELDAEKGKYRQLLNEYDTYKNRLEDLMKALDERKKVEPPQTDAEKAAKAEEARLLKIAEASDLYRSVLAQLKKDLEEVDFQYELHGAKVDVATAKQTALNKAMSALMPTFSAQSAEVQALKKQFDSLEEVAAEQVFENLRTQLAVLNRDFDYSRDVLKWNEDQIKAYQDAYNQLIPNLSVADTRLRSLVDTIRALQGTNITGVIKKMDSLSISIARFKQVTMKPVDVSAMADQPADQFIYAWHRAMESLSDFQNVFNPIMGGIQGVLSSVSQLYQAQENAQIAALEKSAAAQLWTEERLAKEKEKIHKAYAKKKKQIDLAQAFINVALGITSAFVPYVPGLSEVMAGLVASAGAIQIAAIQSQPLATGGIVPSGYPNDTYPARLTSGEMVVPAKKLPDFAGASASKFDDSRIVSAIENKKEVSLNITENGLAVTSKKGLTYTNYITRKYRT